MKYNGRFQVIEPVDTDDGEGGHTTAYVPRILANGRSDVRGTKSDLPTRILSRITEMFGEQVRDHEFLFIHLLRRQVGDDNIKGSYRIRELKRDGSTRDWDILSFQRPQENVLIAVCKDVKMGTKAD